MSSFIETPPFARTIHSLSLVDQKSRKSIRVPCRTPESGLEALEMKDIFESVDKIMARLDQIDQKVKDFAKDVAALQAEDYEIIRAYKIADNKIEMYAAERAMDLERRIVKLGG